MIQLDAQTGEGLSGFLKGWGSLIVAAIALVQPWAIALWRKLVRPGTIDIHETGTIEIGYSSYGPTIGLRGTLRAVHRDHFVRNIELTVIKERDGSHHSFEWLLFKAEKMTSQGKDDISLEIAAGFMLLITQPRSYSILFVDAATRAEIKPALETLQREWTKYATAKGTGPAESIQVAIGKALVESSTAFQNFSKERVATDTYSILERRLYWEPGRYFLQMRVNTTRPENTFHRNWTFELSEPDFQSLRLNAVAIISEACSQVTNYNFAYPAYRERP